MGSETYREARARYIKARAETRRGAIVLAWSPADVCHKIVPRAEMEKDPGDVDCLGGHVVLSLTWREAVRLASQRELGWGEGEG